MHEKDHIGYGELVDEAMRSVVREVLKRIRNEGIPGRHHCFISFSTTHPGVRIAERLKEKYPEEMTIVLQHQFWNLTVNDAMFSVDLSFNNIRETLAIPFDAMTAFADPSVKFGLQFQPVLPDADAPSIDRLPGLETEDTAQPTSDDGDKEKVVSLDAFRKK